MRRAEEQVADLGAQLAPRIRIGFPLLVGIQPFKILVRILQRVSRFRATGLGEALAPQVLLSVGVARHDDLREAVETLEELAQIARRVLGGAHPITVGVETCLRNARAALRARETPPPSGSAP